MGAEDLHLRAFRGEGAKPVLVAQPQAPVGLHQRLEQADLPGALAASEGSRAGLAYPYTKERVRREVMSA